MDKTEATLILAKELANKGYINYVVNRLDQQHIKERSLGFELIYEDNISIVNRTNITQTITETVDSVPTTKQVKMANSITYLLDTDKITEYSKQIGSNYIFCESSIDDRTTLQEEKVSPAKIIPSYHAIITDKEVPILQNLFYKKIDYETKRAFEEIGIEDFSGLYAEYKNGNISSGDIIRYESSNYYIDSNKLKFIFNLPKEEQNIDKNKTLLERVSCDGYVANPKELIDFFYGLYIKKDENFLDYFSFLEKNSGDVWHFDYVRDNTIDMINNAKEDYIDEKVNSELYAKEYSVPVKFMDLYKNNSKAFIRYFDKCKELKKEQIITFVLKLPKSKRNPESENLLLSGKYSALINKTGRMGIKKKEDEKNGNK